MQSWTALHAGGVAPHVLPAPVAPVPVHNARYGRRSQPAHAVTEDDWTRTWGGQRRASSPGKQAPPPQRQQSPDRSERRQFGNRPSHGPGGPRHAAPGPRQQNPASRPRRPINKGDGGAGKASKPTFKMVTKREIALPPSMSPNDLKPRTGLAVTWCGTSSGTPTLQRNVSCTAVSTPWSSVLVDCGEGSHRQLPVAGVALEKVTNVYITHLHGDHCFGLGTTVHAIDQAKGLANAQGVPRRPAAQQRGQPRPSRVTYVWGPPGLAELVHAQLVITGVYESLNFPVVITELVTSEEEATDLQPLVPGANKLLVRRLGPIFTADNPTLAAAQQAVGPVLDAIPQVWKPRRAPARAPSGSADATSAQGGGPSSDTEQELLYSGWNYVAADGLYWDLQSPTSDLLGDDGAVLAAKHGGPQDGLRVFAAQLQHRVPCWGYVLQEIHPMEDWARRRKVVILGDTINSRPIGALALGCDVLSHEATFSKGMEDKCRVAQHSTGWMAGAFAAAVQARTLVLTHFSARYERPGQSNHSHGSTHHRRSGGRGGDEDEMSADEELRRQNEAVSALIKEAQSRHPRGNVIAADDFFTVHVPVQQAAT